MTSYVINMSYTFRRRTHIHTYPGTIVSVDSFFCHSHSPLLTLCLSTLVSLSLCLSLHGYCLPLNLGLCRSVYILLCLSLPSLQTDLLLLKHRSGKSNHRNRLSWLHLNIRCHPYIILQNNVDVSGRADTSTLF